MQLLQIGGSDVLHHAAHELRFEQQTQIENFGRGRRIERHDARTAIANGQDVVVDLSSADRGVRDEWRAFADDVSADLRLVVLTAPFEVLWQRVKKRNDQKQANAVRFTESRLRAYVDGFDWPTDDEHPTVVTTG